MKKIMVLIILLILIGCNAIEKEPNINIENKINYSSVNVMPCEKLPEVINNIEQQDYTTELQLIYLELKEYNYWSNKSFIYYDNAEMCSLHCRGLNFGGYYHFIDKLQRCFCFNSMGLLINHTNIKDIYDFDLSKLKLQKLDYKSIYSK